jgi:3-phosphoshikimate 1-carboxyvinyltransferase
MDLRIRKTTQLNGEIIPPGSKSYSHRAFILAGFADGTSILKNPLVSGDVLVTLDILRTLGVNIEQQNNTTYKIMGKRKFRPKSNLIVDCKNSGTSIRIFSALSLLIEEGLTLKGEFFKRKRPILPLLEALKNVGAEYNLSGHRLRVHRPSYQCKAIKIPGNISSQFITALLFLGPLLECEKKEELSIQITTKLVSYPYINITLNILDAFGIEVEEIYDTNRLPSYRFELSQKIRPKVYEIPSDFSSAAFMIAATILSPEDSKVIIKNLDFEDPQGDKRIIDILQKMGAHLEIDHINNRLICYGNINKNKLKGIKVDCKYIPDLFPILSIIGSYAEGKTVLYNAKILRLKESDRIAIMARELQKMGINVEEYEDKLIIYHCENIVGSTINHEQDHRVAMACTVAALYAQQESKIENIEIVDDSYPTFIEDLMQLGAHIRKIS